MWRKFRFGFSLKINWTSEKNSLSTQGEEIILDRSKVAYKEGGVNRNEWSKVAEKFDFM